MVLCVARWEFLEQRPNWAGGVAVSLWVEPLTLGHATELAMEAGSFLHHGDAERVAQHAGGNPFFIVEIGHVAARGAGPAAVGSGSERAVAPADRASRDRGPHRPARRPRASWCAPGGCLPRGQFDLDELSLIAEPRKELLDEAENDELLVRDDDRPGCGGSCPTCCATSPTTRSRRERQRLHLRVANRLSEGVCGPVPADGRVPPRTAALAALDLNPRDRTLAERAVEALADAGHGARRRIESRSAADLYERALALAGPDGEGRTRGDPSGACSARPALAGEFDAAESALRRAVAIAGRTSDRVCAHASRFLADIALTVHGDAAQATALFDRSLRAARRLGEPLVLARTLLTAGRVPCQANDFPAPRRCSGRRWRSRVQVSGPMPGQAARSSGSRASPPGRRRGGRPRGGARGARRGGGGRARPSRRRSRTVRWRSLPASCAWTRRWTMRIGDPHVP